VGKKDKIHGDNKLRHGDTHLKTRKVKLKKFGEGPEEDRQSG